MGMKRISATLICIFALTSAIQAAAINGQQDSNQLRDKRQTKSCANVGEYCKYHEACCSGLCLSFSYKCVSRPPQSPFDAVIIPNPNPTPPPPPGSNAVDGDLVNRFGEGNSTANQSPPRQCAATGEYCQYSAQCCSQRCLSFSYKCVANPHEQANPGWQNPNNVNNNANRPPTSTVFEVGQTIPGSPTSLDDIVNRFGEGEGSTTASQNPPVTQRPQAAAPPVAQTPTQVNPATCRSNGATCEFSNQCCSDYCQVNSQNTRVCNVRTQTDLPKQEPSLVQNRCLVIGAKCFTHAECCSERCHIYLKQCVT